MYLNYSIGKVTQAMPFIERFIIQCPYYGGSTIGGSAVCMTCSYQGGWLGCVFCKNCTCCDTTIDNISTNVHCTQDLCVCVC